MSFYFAEKTWPELKEAIEKDTLIILPMGTVEEHGKHLPVETDAKIAEKFGEAIGQELKDEIPLLVMPTIWSGYSAKEMSRWPGTIRVRTRVVMDMVFDILGSVIEMGFKKIVILDCHGHHSGLLKTVSREISDKYGVYIAITSPGTFSSAEYQKIRKSAPGGSIHGGEWETSLMMYLTDLVKTDQFTDEDIMKYHSDFVAGDNFAGGQKVTWSTWGIQRSKTGIYGDPTVATKDTGEKVFKAALKEYKKFILEFYKNNKSYEI
ncbi:MAG: creatininase family protein [Clostridia bacterium]|nr:creatininase family protein [Clostridia bacterium]